jgi:hypothetical protein
MVNGTLRCLGSAQHLKNRYVCDSRVFSIGGVLCVQNRFRFGNGYMISARCEMEYVSDVLQSVQSVIPEARLRERRSRQLIWHIQPNVLSIASLFNRMEAARAATQMVSHSLLHNRVLANCTKHNLIVERWIIQSHKPRWMMYSFDLPVFRGKLMRSLTIIMSKVRDINLFEFLSLFNVYVSFIAGFHNI